jgi:hypothetical protein
MNSVNVLAPALSEPADADTADGDAEHAVHGIPTTRFAPGREAGAPGMPMVTPRGTPASDFALTTETAGAPFPEASNAEA